VLRKSIESAGCTDTAARHNERQAEWSVTSDAGAGAGSHREGQAFRSEIVDLSGLDLGELHAMPRSVLWASLNRIFGELARDTDAIAGFRSSLPHDSSSGTASTGRVAGTALPESKQPLRDADSDEEQ